MTSTRPRRRHSFAAKGLAAAALIGMADLLFYGWRPAATLGVFALAWAGTLALVRPEVRRHTAARISLAAAASFAVIVFDDPSLLGWCLFWTAMASATVLPRQGFHDAISWIARLIGHAVFGIAIPLRDLHRLVAPRRSSDRTSIKAVLAVLALPVTGGGMFLALFANANANPIIGDAFEAIYFPDLSSVIGHVAFWLAVLLAIWPNLRPRYTVLPLRIGAAESGSVAPDIPLGTLTLSLLTSNVIFAVQNGLDLAFLWSGAPLPAGVTLADYAHRGAYLLIVSALLAGVFALVASRAGSVGAQSTTVGVFWSPGSGRPCCWSLQASCARWTMSMPFR